MDGRVEPDGRVDRMIRVLRDCAVFAMVNPLLN
jgi:hypothetical protein